MLFVRLEPPSPTPLQVDPSCKMQHRLEARNAQPRHWSRCGLAERGQGAKTGEESEAQAVLDPLALALQTACHSRGLWDLIRGSSPTVQEDLRDLLVRCLCEKPGFSSKSRSFMKSTSMKD